MLTAEKLASIDNDIETFRQCEHWVHMAMELRTNLFHYMSQPPVIDAGDPNNLPANLVKCVSWGESVADGLKKADAKIAELEARIASHVCAGPTTINLTENAAVQEFTAELRRELAEERNHVRQHKATIEAQGRSIESLLEQIRQAQQDAAKGLAPWDKYRRRAVIQAVGDVRNALYAWLDIANESPGKAVSIPSGRIRDVIQSLTFRPPTDDGLDLLSTLAELRHENETLRAAAARRDEESGGPAPDVVRLQQDLQASETARANAENRVSQLQQFADKPLFDQYERFCNRIIDACREGDAHGTISSMAEQALKDMGAPPF